MKNLTNYTDWYANTSNLYYLVMDIIQHYYPNFYIGGNLILNSTFHSAYSNRQLDVLQALCQVKRDELDFNRVNKIFIKACCDGHLDVVNLLYETFNEMNLDINRAFFRACCRDNMYVAQLLHQLEPETTSFLATSNFFLAICQMNKLSVVKFLYTTFSIDITIDNHYAFVWSYRIGNKDMCKWLILCYENNIVYLINYLFDENMTNEVKFIIGQTNSNKLILNSSHQTTFNELVAATSSNKKLK